MAGAHRATLDRHAAKAQLAMTKRERVKLYDNSGNDLYQKKQALL
jgi:hypothetical protein